MFVPRLTGDVIPLYLSARYCGRTAQFNLILSVLASHLTLSTQETKLNTVFYREHSTRELENPCFHQDHKQVNKAYNIFNHFIHHKLTKI